MLAGGTSAEELIEGMTIGVGATFGPKVALIVGLAICIDNFSEGMSIGELTLDEERKNAKRSDGPPSSASPFSCPPLQGGSC